jgi:hypothetical protein
MSKIMWVWSELTTVNKVMRLCLILLQTGGRYIMHTRSSLHCHLFMEPDNSLPRSQELAKISYPEPLESGPHPHPHPYCFYNILVSAVLPSARTSSKSSDFPIQFLYAFVISFMRTSRYFMNFKSILCYHDWHTFWHTFHTSAYSTQHICLSGQHFSRGKSGLKFILRCSELWHHAVR